MDIHQQYELARHRMDRTVLPMIEALTEQMRKDFGYDFRLGFEIEGTPERNKHRLLTRDDITAINHKIAEKLVPMDDLVRKNQEQIAKAQHPYWDLSPEDTEKQIRAVIRKQALQNMQTPIDVPMGVFNYDFLEYELKTGALKPTHAVVAVNFVKDTMQAIASEYGFGRFLFSGHDPVYRPNQHSNALHTNISLWQQKGDEKLNVIGNPSLRQAIVGSDDFKDILIDAAIFLSPREHSFKRFHNHNPSSPRYGYINYEEEYLDSSRQGIVGIKGKKDTARIENRLPCMDALPSIAALVTMLAVYDAMKENIERRGATWMGKLNLDWPREPGEIYRDYDAALATLHDREYNRFYKALTRTFGPALADGLFDQYGEYLGIQEKHDAALVDEYLQTHEQTDGPPPNPAAVTHHLQGLLTKYLPKATEDLAYLKQGYDKQAEPTLPDGFDHPALNAWLESLHPIIENIQSQLVYMRQFIQRIPPAERSNRLSEACATIAPQCCLLHDELLLTLKQTSPRAQLETTGELTEKAYNEILGHMADYIVNNCVEQMLGDLIMQQDYGEVWPGCPSYLLSDETHRTAEAAVQRVLLAQGTRDKHLESPQLRDVSPEEYKGLLSPAPLKGTGHFPQG